MRSWRLEYVDGNYAIAIAPSLMDGFLVRLHLEAMQLAMAEEVVHPIGEAEEKILYDRYQPYYRQLGKHFGIECDRLTSASRHRFFVCTDPIKHPLNGDLVVGLGGIAQLLGYEYSAGAVERPKHTTGDSTLDVLTDCLLVFKGVGMEVARTISTEDIALMLVQANNRMTVEDDSKKKKVGELPQVEAAPDVPEFLRHRDRITQGLIAMGVDLPRGW